jgi:hypothetical protein
MRRSPSLLGMLVLAVTLGLTGCGASQTTNTPPATASPNSTVGPGTTTGQGSTPPCTIPQNNGGDHDADNNGGPNDGDGCDR